MSQPSESLYKQYTDTGKTNADEVHNVTTTNLHAPGKEKLQIESASIIY